MEDPQLILLFLTAVVDILDHERLGCHIQHSPNTDVLAVEELARGVSGLRRVARRFNVQVYPLLWRNFRVALRCLLQCVQLDLG